MINANLAIERSTTIISTDTLINVQDTCCTQELAKILFTCIIKLVIMQV